MATKHMSISFVEEKEAKPYCEEKGQPTVCEVRTKPLASQINVKIAILPIYDLIFIGVDLGSGGHETSTSINISVLVTRAKLPYYVDIRTLLKFVAYFLVFELANHNLPDGEFDGDKSTVAPGVKKERSVFPVCPVACVASADTCRATEENFQPSGSPIYKTRTATTPLCVGSARAKHPVTPF
uniref:Uncharacterized protein n=1 Tax=Timema tahoe TaxID=61484 RepID=A0A7R9NU98_9NEOP|nr:unnamed protein product [Timema tahoe]